MAGRSPHDRAQYHVRGKAGCRPIVGRACVAGPQPASQADHRRWNGCGEVELAALQQSPGDQQKETHWQKGCYPARRLDVGDKA